MDLIPFDCQISLTLIIKYPLNWFDKSLICYRIRTHVVKFMEGVILTLSRKTSVWCEITCIYWMLSLCTFLTLINYIIRLIYPEKILWKYVLFFYVYFSYLNKLYHKIDLSWKETLKICFVFLCLGFWNSKIFKAGSWGYPRYCSWRQQNSESQTFRGARQTDVWNLVTIPSLPTHI